MSRELPTFTQGINGNTSLRYSEFREGAFDFQTSQQNHLAYKAV